MTEMFEPVDHYGEPDLSLGALSVWVLERAYPDSGDWDRDWLVIHARVETYGARVDVTGTLLRSVEIAAFQTDLVILSQNLRGTAALNTLEPGLRARVLCDVLGHLTIHVEITPESQSQRHTFEFSSDQTFLPAMLRGCREILRRFPVSGEP